MTQPLQDPSPPRSPEWDPRPDPASHSSDQPTESSTARSRAALFLWIANGLSLAMWGCFVVAFVTIHFMSLEEFIRNSHKIANADQQIRTIQQIKPYSHYFALAIFLPGMVPAIASCLLAFGVRKHHRGQTLAAQILCIAQCIVLGMITLSSLANALAAGKPVDVTVTVLTIGTLLALQINAARWLLTAQPLGRRSNPAPPPEI